MEWLYKKTQELPFAGYNLFARIDMQICRNFGNALWDFALASILRDHEAMKKLREDAEKYKHAEPSLNYWHATETDPGGWRYLPDDYGDGNEIEWSAADPADAILASRE